MADYQRPLLDLKVGDEVFTRKGYGKVKDWTPGKVTDVARKYATVDFGFPYLNGKYDKVTGRKIDDTGYIVTQAQLDWAEDRDADTETLKAAGLDDYRLSKGLRAAVAAFLRTVDEDGNPL
jgi:hypothetical protein